MAFTPRNIKSGWTKTRLFTFNPDRVLKDIPKPQVEEIVRQAANMPTDLPSYNDVLRTPVTWESLTCLQTKIEQSTALDFPTRHCFQKFAKATGNYLADRTILLDENRLLRNQNDEKTTRQSVRWADIAQAEQKRAAKEAVAPGVKRGSRRPQRSKPDEGKRSREITALGLEEYCTVLQF